MSFGSANPWLKPELPLEKGLVSLKLSMVAELRLSFASVSFASFACKHQRPGAKRTMIRETTLRLQSLDAPSAPGPSSGVRDANPSLQRQHHNLGTRKGGVTCGVGRHSTKSLLRASLKAKMARSFPELDRVAPANRKGSLYEKAPPRHFAGEEGTNKLSEVPPPNPHELDLDQLRALIESLQMTVQKLAEHSFGKQKGEHSTNNTNNNNNNEHNTNDNNNNNNNNNNHTHNTNNTNNNNYNTTTTQLVKSLA